MQRLTTELQEQAQELGTEGRGTEEGPGEGKFTQWGCADWHLLPTPELSPPLQWLGREQDNRPEQE